MALVIRQLVILSAALTLLISSASPRKASYEFRCSPIGEVEAPLIGVRLMDA
jgi:hypothetical protein